MIDFTFFIKFTCKIVKFIFYIFAINWFLVLCIPVYKVPVDTLQPAIIFISGKFTCSKSTYLGLNDKVNWPSGWWKIISELICTGTTMDHFVWLIYPKLNVFFVKTTYSIFDTYIVLEVRKELEWLNKIRLYCLYFKHCINLQMLVCMGLLSWIRSYKCWDT